MLILICVTSDKSQVTKVKQKTLLYNFQSFIDFMYFQIHISKYEVKELEIWSELQHKNIVQLIGTLRRGEKIYIMSEFIDGRNLIAVLFYAQFYSVNLMT